MNARTIGIALLLLCATAITAAWPNRNSATRPKLTDELSKVDPHNRWINIVYHGHSVPAGYHVTPEVRPWDSYPHLVAVALARRYPGAQINTILTAKPGENSTDGAKRFSQALAHAPDVVLIDYVLNDRENTTPKRMRLSWQSMIDAAKAAGVPVVLLTPTGDSKANLDDPADPLNTCAQLVRDLGRENGVPVADVLDAWKRNVRSGTPREALLSQHNHPNRAGHEIAAKAIVATLLEK